MPEGLRGLTTRGGIFLAVGAIGVVLALATGQADVMKLGMLLALLPILAAALVGRTRYRLALLRTLRTPTVAVGQTAEVDLTLTNDGPAPRGVLLLEEQVPYLLGTRPRFVLSGLGAGWQRTVSYPIRSEVRGRFELGPMTVRYTDPFGLVALGRAFRATTPIVVTPRVIALPMISVTSSASGAGDKRPRSFAVGSAEDITIREYHHGDDLRRVHWPSSARMGELMVRREEQPWQSRATVFVDNRESAHRGVGLGCSLENAVSAAASVAVHLAERGFMVRLVSSTGEHDATAWHMRETNTVAQPLLEALAVLGPAARSAIDGSWISEHGQGGVIVAVMGSWTSADLPILRRMASSADNALAIAIDVNRWDGGPARTTTSAMLPGWRTATLTPGDQLESVWQQLGRQLQDVPQ
ncbi:MAG: DUF58 domain-containing protein [Nocardioides sp.]